MPTVSSSYSTLDYWSRLAARLHYPSRAVFKLKQIDEKLFQSRLFFPHSRVLDLGSSPGSWAKYAAERAPHGFVYGVDLNCMAIAAAHKRFPFPSNYYYKQADIYALSPSSFKQRFHVLLSDLAPATSGDHLRDSRECAALAWRATELAQKLLIETDPTLVVSEASKYNSVHSIDRLKENPHGVFITKIFEGKHSEQLIRDIENIFHSVKVYKPPASRSESKETYIIAQKLKEKK